MAIRGAADRLSFLGIRLGPEDADAANSSVQCQVEAWIRGLGVVSAHHSDADSYIAIDRAAALLEQAVLRKLGQANAPETDEQELYAALTSD
jgi:hypothetical protein